MRKLLRRVKKALGALLGGVTAAGVVGVAEAVGLEVSLPVAGALAVLLSTLGTYVAPKNQEPSRG